MQAGFVAAALAVALWSGHRSRAATASPHTGEATWSIVAMAVLVAVLEAVHYGSTRGL